ncbi:MAG: UPF0149 family protein [Woeseiaceae bacterium]|nr:UPF0149 family protein [Woeseiaceae bacterium]
MDRTIDHGTLEAALGRCGATWNASQAHGLLVGRLASIGVDAGFDWLGQVLEGTAENDALRAECEGLLRDVFEQTYRQLAERQSEFELLLPDDSAARADRAASIAHWCEGFLHGLVSGGHDEALKKKLAADPLAEIIRDVLQFTRATAEETADDESDEQAYAEIVEYLRVAAQLAYEELAALRHPAGPGEPEADAIH